jgi:hypothetical protein
MKRSTLQTALLALALCQANNVLAQSMEFGCPAQGTVIKFSTGQQLKAVGRQGFFCQVENASGTPLESYALMYLFTEARKREPASGKYISPIAVEKLWPLSVGKKHSGRATLPDGTYDLEYTVLGVETIDGPLGAHEAFVVELREVGGNVSGSYTATAKWWISPLLNYHVKYEFGDSRGRSLNYSVTAVVKP